MLSFIHYMAYGGYKIIEVNQHSNQMLDKLQKGYLDMFSEPMYSIWEYRQPFQILLIDTSSQSTHHHLYPLSSKELTALQKLTNGQLESDFIVPLASPYGHPVLFAEKRGGEGFYLYIYYHSLNANTVTDNWPLLCIDNLIS